MAIVRADVGSSNHSLALFIMVVLGADYVVDRGRSEVTAISKGTPPFVLSRSAINS